MLDILFFVALLGSLCAVLARLLSYRERPASLFTCPVCLAFQLSSMPVRFCLRCGGRMERVYQDDALLAFPYWQHRPMQAEMRYLARGTYYYIKLTLRTPEQLEVFSQEGVFAETTEGETSSMACDTKVRGRIIKRFLLEFVARNGGLTVFSPPNWQMTLIEDGTLGLMDEVEMLLEQLEQEEER